MRILLTGAEGFTGRHLTKHAEARGHNILPLRADLTDPEAVQREVVELAPDAAVHLAAISFVGHEDATAFYAVNVLGTVHLLEALSALSTRPRGILLASSANIYGNCAASPIAETQPPAPVNHYASSKLAMEHMARTYGERLPLVFTRPFNYTGPGQALSFVIPKLVDHFARRADHIELGNLHVEREFNDVRMVSEVYLDLLEQGEPGEAYNICTGRTYTLEQVLDELSDLTGHVPRIEVNPAFVRANELHRLCGNPAKLQALARERGFAIPEFSLRETLESMLNAAG